MKKALALVIISLLACNQFASSAVTRPADPLLPLWVMPNHISYPKYTKPGVEAQYALVLENRAVYPITLNSIAAIEDSARPSAPDGWLGYSSAPAHIPVGGMDTLILELNNNGVVASGPVRLWGKLRIVYSPSGVLEIPVDFIVADTIVMPQFDTVITHCGHPLTIGTNGNLGRNFFGGANLGFPQPSPECDTGSNNRGDAGIYLGDASPVIVRRVAPNDYAASWSIYDGHVPSPNEFKPLYPSSARGSFSSAGHYDGYNTGTFCTVDSLVKLERTIWAPLNSADSCRFVIMRTRIFPYTIGWSVPNLAIGDVFDFDVPSDSGEFYNVAGTDPTRRLVYQRGFDSPDTVSDCYNNGLRYAGAALLSMSFKNMVLESSLYGGYNAANDSFVYPSGGFVPDQLWANMQSTGYSNESRITDLHSMLVYKNGAASVGFTLPANDTLTIWTAIAVVRPTGGTIAQGLDSLKKEIDKASKWYHRVGPIDFSCGCCCIGTRGNVNQSPNETPDLSDLSLLIAHLIQNPRPTLPNFREADVTADCVIDLSDLSLLIAYLTQDPRPTMPNC